MKLYEMWGGKEECWFRSQLWSDQVVCHLISHTGYDGAGEGGQAQVMVYARQPDGRVAWRYRPLSSSEVGALTWEEVPRPSWVSEEGSAAAVDSAVIRLAAKTGFLVS